MTSAPSPAEYSAATAKAHLFEDTRTWLRKLGLDDTGVEEVNTAIFKLVRSVEQQALLLSERDSEIERLKARSEIDTHNYGVMTNIHEAQLSEARAEVAHTVADYEEVLADHRRLVRELDVALNGEQNAARQASLCDVVSQVQAEKIRARHHPIAAIQGDSQ